jgi:hypothetical protein
MKEKEEVLDALDRKTEDKEGQGAEGKAEQSIHILHNFYNRKL